VIGDTLEEGRDQHDDVHRLIADTFEISDDLSRLGRAMTRPGRDRRALVLDLPPALTRVRGLCAIAVELPQDALHVLARLPIGRNPPMGDHRVLAGVVGGKDERQIVAESVTPRVAAVAGMSCISPWAPRGETARGLNWDSISTIAATRFSGTSYRVADERTRAGRG